MGACISFMHYWKGQHYQVPKGLLVHWQYFSRVDVYLFQDKVKGKGRRREELLLIFFVV